MANHSVIVVGAGPTGLMLAGELALAGVDVAIVERRPDQSLTGSRAGGLHARTIEILDQRGIAGRFIDEGHKAQVTSFAWNALDISDFPTPHGYGLALKQRDFERILSEWVESMPVTFYRACEVTGHRQHETGVEIALSNGNKLACEYLVGCDGGRSTIRKEAKIKFPGWDATVSNLVAEVDFAETPVMGLRHDARGIQAISRIKDSNGYWVVVTEGSLNRTGKPELKNLQDALVDAYGTDFGVCNPRWLSRFTDAARQAEHYRKGRVLLAGDSAHIHYPVGGQGLNIGVQDAVNLGWKLAQVVHRVSAEGLLDTYHSERYPIAARVLRTTLAQVALLKRPDERMNAFCELLGELCGLDQVRKKLGAMISGLDICYYADGDHPLVGRRVPDIKLFATQGPSRIFECLHEAKPVLLNFGLYGSIDIAGWKGRIKVIDARSHGTWELPLVGAFDAPFAVLIRPDGHVAWVGQNDYSGLRESLIHWHGEPHMSV